MLHSAHKHVPEGKRSFGSWKIEIKASGDKAQVLHITLIFYLTVLQPVSLSAFLHLHIDSIKLFLSHTHTHTHTLREVSVMLLLSCNPWQQSSTLLPSRPAQLPTNVVNDPS